MNLCHQHSEISNLNFVLVKHQVNNFHKIDKKSIIKRKNHVLAVNDCCNSSILYQKVISEVNEKSNNSINPIITKV